MLNENVQLNEHITWTELKELVNWFVKVLKKSLMACPWTQKYVG